MGDQHDLRVRLPSDSRLASDLGIPPLRRDPPPLTCGAPSNMRPGARHPHSGWSTESPSRIPQDSAHVRNERQSPLWGQTESTRIVDTWGSIRGSIATPRGGQFAGLTGTLRPDMLAAASCAEFVRSRMRGGMATISEDSLGARVRRDYRSTYNVPSEAGTLAFAALWLGYLVAAYVSFDKAWPSLCPFRRLTGIRCPFCGMTTATGCLLRGDLFGARQAHPLGPVVMPVTGLWLIREFWLVLRHLQSKGATR